MNEVTAVSRSVFAKPPLLTTASAQSCRVAWSLKPPAVAKPLSTTSETAVQQPSAVAPALHAVLSEAGLASQLGMNTQLVANSPVDSSTAQWPAVSTMA